MLFDTDCAQQGKTFMAQGNVFPYCERQKTFNWVEFLIPGPGNSVYRMFSMFPSFNTPDKNDWIMNRFLLSLLTNCSSNLFI